MATARIFNVQRYSLHDGPGIRTLVFLKGCSLRCEWCSNPEGICPRPQPSYDRQLCVKCRRCLECPEKAVFIDRDRGFVTDMDVCTGCGLCAEHCPTEARTMWGENVPVTDIVKRAARDKAFYDTSGGGITLGGGDPLLQPDAALEILKTSKEQGLNTAIETAGFYEFANLEAVVPYCDCIFIDIKAWDSEKHQRLVQADLDKIKDNIKRLDALLDTMEDKPDWTIRIPLLPEYNFTLEDFRGLAEFLKTLKNAGGFEILPFHNFGSGKYEKLNKFYALRDKPNVKAEEVEEYLQILLDNGLNASILSW